jgi:hypothetical protein
MANTYNTEFQSNNIDLQSILDKINSLPSAGGTTSGIQYTTGTLMSGSDGVILFPELNFTPKMITVWNIVGKDLKAEAEAEGGEWDDSYVRYVHDGIMLTAMYIDDETWVSQVVVGSSGETMINASADLDQDGEASNYPYGECAIHFDGKNYYYRLYRGAGAPECVAEVEFNYVIYG